MSYEPPKDGDLYVTNADTPPQNSAYENANFMLSMLFIAVLLAVGFVLGHFLWPRC